MISEPYFPLFPYVMTLYTICSTDPETNETIILSETYDEDAAYNEVERLNSWATDAGRSATAYYLP